MRNNILEQREKKDKWGTCAKRQLFDSSTNHTLIQPYTLFRHLLCVEKWHVMWYSTRTEYSATAQTYRHTIFLRTLQVQHEFRSGEEEEKGEEELRSKYINSSVSSLSLLYDLTMFSHHILLCFLNQSFTKCTACTFPGSVLTRSYSTDWENSVKLDSVTQFPQWPWIMHLGTVQQMHRNMCWQKGMAGVQLGWGSEVGIEFRLFRIISKAPDGRQSTPWWVNDAGRWQDQ